MWSAWMIAAALAAGCAVYAGLVVHAVSQGAPAWPFIAAVPFVYLGILTLFVAWYFALAWLFRSPRPPQARIGPAATLRLVWNEYLTLAGAAFRMLLYRLLVPEPPPAPARLPVLLLHGVLCNAGVWARFVRFFRMQGVAPVYALSYGPPLASIELFADQVHERIGQIQAVTGAAQVMLVAHSMGGLIALAYLRRYGSERVRRLVVIGTPFRGSVHARGFVGTSLSQLRPGNAWLRALDARAPPGGPPVVSIWSWHDSMVAPQTSSELPGATNIALTGVGHTTLLRDPDVMAHVLREYRTALASRPDPLPPQRGAGAAAEPRDGRPPTSESPA